MAFYKNESSIPSVWFFMLGDEYGELALEISRKNYHYF